MTPANSEDALPAERRTPGHDAAKLSLVQSTLNLHDLELMHHFSTVTCFTLTEKESIQRIWQVDIPSEALSHTFLMHGVLAFAALHLLQTSPPSKHPLYSDLAMTHQHLAITTFTPMLNNITEENCSALFAFSCVVAASSFAYLRFSDHHKSATVDIKNLVDVFDLLMGCTVILRKTRPWVEEGRLAPLLRPDHFNPEFNESANSLALPADIETALESLMENSKSSTQFGDIPDIQDMPNSTDHPNAHSIYASSIQQLRNGFVRVALYPSDQPLVISWPVLVGPSYLALLKKFDPMALCVLAHYAVVLHSLNDVWWMKGLAPRMVEAIAEILGAEWEPLLRWALDKTRVNAPGSLDLRLVDDHTAVALVEDAALDSRP